MPDQVEAQNDIILAFYAESEIFVSLCKLATLRAARLVLRANGGLVEEERGKLAPDVIMARLELAKRILARKFDASLVARIAILDEGIRDQILVEDPANGGNLHHPPQGVLCAAIRDAWSEMAAVGTFRGE